MRCLTIIGLLFLIGLPFAARATEPPPAPSGIEVSAPAEEPPEAVTPPAAESNPAPAAEPEPTTPPPAAAEAEVSQTPDAAPVKDYDRVIEELKQRMEELEKKNLKLTGEVYRLQFFEKRARGELSQHEADIEDIQDEMSHRTFGIGSGLAFTTGGKTEPLSMFEANLRWVAGYYVVGRGYGLGFMPTIEIWRFRIRPVVGAFFYQNQNRPLSVKYLPRWWDFMLSLGLDTRIWKGFEIKFQALWLIPNPEALGRLGVRTLLDNPPQVDASWSGEWDDPPDVKFDYPGPRKALKSVNQALKDAFAQPVLYLGIRWEF